MGICASHTADEASPPLLRTIPWGDAARATFSNLDCVTIPLMHDVVVQHRTVPLFVIKFLVKPDGTPDLRVDGWDKPLRDSYDAVFMIRQLERKPEVYPNISDLLIGLVDMYSQ